MIGINHFPGGKAPFKMSLQRLPSREGIDAVTHAVPAEGSLTRTLAVLKVPFILAAIWKFQMNLTVYLSRILPPVPFPAAPFRFSRKNLNGGKADGSHHQL